MFLTLAQIFKPGGFTGAVGTPNFLLDLNPYVTEVQWTNSQIGDMQSATLRCRLAYEQDLDIIAGNWVIFACMGGRTQSAYAATATEITVENAADDLGNQHFFLGDPIVISDGTNSEVFTIGAISWSGSTATITLAAAQSQNSTALLNGYAAGTTVARLRWQGMITARKRTTDLSNIFSIIVQGMMWRYTKVIGDFAIKNQDSATSMLKIAQAYTSQVPEIIVNSANFAPANNIMYTGSSKHTSIAKLIGDVLKTESGGAVPTQPNEASYWSFWVDELRQAHHAQIPTINSSSPTYSVDLLNGNSYGDVLGPVQPQDMDMARMLNCAVVEGGKDNNGKVVDIIVTHKPSYTQWGYYEGFLSNPNISGGTTSEVASALATWAAGQIGVLAWPQQSGRFQFIVASMRLTCRDLLEITGFTDSSTLITNPTQIQYTASMAKMIVTGAVNITQQQPDEAALIREIAGMQSLRTSDRGSSTSIQSSETAGAYVISGLDVAVSGLNWTTTAGQVFFEGATYDIPAANGSVAANDQIRLGVQVSGTPPAGYAVPCVCPMPNFVANTRLSAGQWFELTNPPAATTAPSVTVDGTAGTTEYQYQIVASNAGGDSAASPATTVTTGNATLSTANYNALSWTAATDASEYKVLRQVGGTGGFELLAVTSATTLSDQGQYTPSAYTPAGSPNYAGMVQQTSFAGVYLATLSTFSGTSIDIVQETTPWGGVGSWNLKAITGGTLSVSGSPSVTVTAEGSASARVQISCAVIGITYDDTIASFDVVRSFAGENLWGLPFIAIHAPANGTVAFTDHGLAAGQGYDYGIIARGRNGEPLNAAPVLIGTSPTVSAAAVTAALTNANLPSMPAGATITVSAVSETVYESGMHTLITGGPIGLAPVVEVDFTLGDANTPPATQWGAGFVGYIRQTGTTAYARVPQGHSATSLTNGSAQSVRFHVTPGESYDAAVTLADAQGNETPQVALFTNYSVAKMGRGDPIGPIWGRGHFLGDLTGDITTAISDGTDLVHGIMSGATQARIGADKTLHVDGATGPVSGFLPQPNHDPTVLQGSLYANNQELVQWAGAVVNSGGWIDVTNSSWMSGGTPNVNGPFRLDADVWANGTGNILEFAIWDGTTGYIFRFDSRAAVVPGQILILTAPSTWSGIGTAKVSTSASNLAAGWYHLTGFYHGSGKFDVLVNNQWQTTAIDTTYAAGGAWGITYQYEVAVGRFRNLRIAQHLPTSHDPTGKNDLSQPFGYVNTVPLLGHDPTVQTGASRANAAIDSGNIVVAAGIDLSRKYLNKNQDNVPEGGALANWDPANTDTGTTLTNGNLTATVTTGGAWTSTRSTPGQLTGKWYWEITVVASSGGSFTRIGVTNASALTVLGSDGNSWGYECNGDKGHAGSDVAYGATFINGDVIGVALDLDDGTLTFFKNGVSQGVAFSTGLTGAMLYPGATGYSLNDAVTANFGASNFAYAPPSGFIAYGSTFARVASSETSGGSIAQLKRGANIRTVETIVTALDSSGRIVGNIYDGTTALSPANLTSVILPTAPADNSFLQSGTVGNRHILSTAVGATQMAPRRFSTSLTNTNDGGTTWDLAGAAQASGAVLTNGDIYTYNTGAAIDAGSGAPTTIGYNLPASSSVTLVLTHLAFTAGGNGTPAIFFTGNAVSGSISEETTAVSGSSTCSVSTNSLDVPRLTNGATVAFSDTTGEGPSATYPIALDLTSVNCPTDTYGNTSSLSVNLLNPSNVVVASWTGVTAAGSMSYAPGTAGPTGTYTWDVWAVPAATGTQPANTSSSMDCTFSGTVSYWTATGGSGSTYVLAADGVTQRTSTSDGNILFTQISPNMLAFKVYNSDTAQLGFTIGVVTQGV